MRQKKISCEKKNQWISLNDFVNRISFLEKLKLGSRALFCKSYFGEFLKCIFMSYPHTS